MAKPKIIAKKYQGDDCYSWAVFRDGDPFITGLSRSEAKYYRDEEKKKYT